MMGQPVIQFQIVAKDPDGAAQFYTRLFDWRVNSDNLLKYRMIDTGSERGIGGGICPSPPEGHSFVQLFVGDIVISNLSPSRSCDDPPRRGTRRSSRRPQLNARRLAAAPSS